MKRSRAGKAGRSRAVVSALAAGYLALAPLHAFSTSKDGIFPTADQVGGQVYTDPVKPGTPFPADIEVFDLAGKQVDLAKLIAGKKTVIAFFIIVLGPLITRRGATSPFPVRGNTRMYSSPGRSLPSTTKISLWTVSTVAPYPGD